MLLFHQRSHSVPVGHAFINTTTDKDQSSLIHLKDTSPLPINDFFGQSNSVVSLYEENNRDNDYTNKRCMVLLECRMDRGFFFTSECHWTCYRRNYFQVTASFSIPGITENLVLQLPTKVAHVQALFIRLRACTSDNPIKPIALTQMTPKRDKGPQREPPIMPVGLQGSTVTFERLQFKIATANNGKKRASQQFFRLVFELVAQSDDELHVVSECYSQPLVVRGRSPGHYNTDPLEPRRRRKYSQPEEYLVSPPSFQLIPQNYFHARSHSVNDTFHRQRPYDTGALAHWRHHQREGDGYDGYMGSGYNSPYSASSVHQWPDVQ